jgi:hypothetical protein
MEGTLHSVNGSAETRHCTDALSSTLHGSVRIHLAPVRRHLTTCNALLYVLEMCMYKLGSSITPGNALGGHYLREPRAEPKVWSVMPWLPYMKNLKHMHFMKLKPCSGSRHFLKVYSFELWVRWEKPLGSCLEGGPHSDKARPLGLCPKHLIRTRTRWSCSFYCCTSHMHLDFQDVWNYRRRASLSFDHPMFMGALKLRAPKPKSPGTNKSRKVERSSLLLRTNTNKVLQE